MLDPALDNESLVFHSRVKFRDIDNIRSKPKLRDLALLMRYMHDDYPKYFLHAVSYRHYTAATHADVSTQQNCWWVATMVQICLRALFGGEWVSNNKPGLDWVTAKELRKTVEKCAKFYRDESYVLSFCCCPDYSSNNRPQSETRLQLSWQIPRYEGRRCDGVSGRQTHER